MIICIMGRDIKIKQNVYVPVGPGIISWSRDDTDIRTLQLIAYW